MKSESILTSKLLRSGLLEADFCGCVSLFSLGLLKENLKGVSLEMELEITNKDDYILVETAKGMDSQEIIEGISKLFSMPEFKDKNDLWVFRSGKVKMMHADLDNIIEFAEKLYPSDSKATKTAIVAYSAVQHSLAVLYADIGKNLPREIRPFSDLKSAEAWIKR